MPVLSWGRGSEPDRQASRRFASRKMSGQDFRCAFANVSRRIDRHGREHKRKLGEKRDGVVAACASAAALRLKTEDARLFHHAAMIARHQSMRALRTDTPNARSRSIRSSISYRRELHERLYRSSLRER